MNWWLLKTIFPISSIHSKKTVHSTLTTHTFSAHGNIHIFPFLCLSFSIDDTHKHILLLLLCPYCSTVTLAGNTCPICTGALRTPTLTHIHIRANKLEQNDGDRGRQTCYNQRVQGLKKSDFMYEICCLRIVAIGMWCAVSVCSMFVDEFYECVF